MNTSELRDELEGSIDGRLGHWAEFRGNWFFYPVGFVFSCPSWPTPAANDRFFFGNLVR